MSDLYQAAHLHMKRLTFKTRKTESDVNKMGFLYSVMVFAMEVAYRNLI